MKTKLNEKFFKGKRILITGGLGFLGSNMAIRLVKIGADVTLVDSMIYGHGGNLFNISEIRNNVRINFSDIRDGSAMDFLVRDFDLMFNFAGQVSHIDSMSDPYTDLQINARSQLSMLEACRKYNPGIKIVFASTRQVYGKPEYLPVDEKHPLRPTDVNGINKVAAESYHVLYHNVYGIKTVCLRMTNTYGPRLLMKHKRQGFIGWFVRQLIDERDIEIFGDGRQLRDLNYIDDAIEAFLICASDDSLNGQIYNLGSSPPISLEDIAKLLIGINGSGTYRLVPFPEENRRIDIGHYYASYDRFNHLTGWKPLVSCEEGLSKMIAYYKEHKQYYW